MSNAVVRETQAATPGLLKEVAQFSVTEGTLVEDLGAHGSVAGLQANICGVDEGGVVCGNVFSGVGEQLGEKFLLRSTESFLLRLQLTQHLAYTPVLIEFAHSGQQNVLFLLGRIVDGTFTNDASSKLELCDGLLVKSIIR